MTNGIGSCPTAEELASYIDGTLGKEEAQRVAEHLADCESCYELYSEVLRFQLESPAEESNIVSFPSSGRREVRRWLPLAAAAVVAIGLGFALYPQFAPIPTLGVAELTKPIQDVREIQTRVWEHNRFRSGDGLGESELDRRSFQVGALLVDYRLALGARDAARAYDSLQTIGAAVETVDFMSEVGDEILEDALRLNPEGKKPKETEAVILHFEGRFSELENSLGGELSMLDPPYLSFGKWTEAGRLAAVAQRAAFFEIRENRRFLKALLRQKDVEPSEEALGHLREIQRIWKARNFTPAEFQSLEQRFQGILAVYDFQGNVGPEGSRTMPSVPAPVPPEQAPKIILTKL